jgi:hypothetical protein
VKVPADGSGVASRAGCELLRELAAASGLVGARGRALIGIYSGLPSTSPARCLPSCLISSTAAGAISISGPRALRDQAAPFSAGMSTQPRMSRFPWDFSDGPLGFQATC